MYQLLNIGSGPWGLALGPLCIAPVLAYLPPLGREAVVVGGGQLAGEHQVEHPARCLEYVWQRDHKRVGVRHGRVLASTTRHKPLAAHVFAPPLLGLSGGEILDQLFLREAALATELRQAVPRLP